MALSLRARLLWLVGVALLPVALFALASLIALGQQQREQSRQALVERARAMASAVDLELEGSVAALQVLAQARSLDAGDLRRFHADAQAAAAARPAWDSLLLADLEGKWLSSTRVAYGAPLPGRGAVVERESFAALVASGRPVIGYVAKGPGGRFLFPVRVVEEHGAALPAGAQERLHKVSASAHYLARLIDALLAFSQLARRPVQRQRVDVAALVEESLRVLRGERAVQVVLGEVPDCEADPQLLRQVFHHLIDNAIKYSAGAAAPRVEIGWQDSEGAYTVRDNGAGFDMQFAGKLFGLFERLHSPGENDGTGLGLAIVKRIVQRHGGRVWAEAAPGKGAIFYFTLRA